MANEVICKTCVFYAPYGGGAGQCRRFPPQVNMRDGGDVGSRTDFPYVRDPDWCGEHPNFGRPVQG
jgi:hypothetical protein